MIELLSALFNVRSLFLFSFFISWLALTFIGVGVDKFFDQADDSDDKEEDYQYEGDEYDTSLAILYDGIGHGFKT